MTYVELHCHSAYSFLDGASQPEELATRAAELGYAALALTDHDGVYGSLEVTLASSRPWPAPPTGQRSRPPRAPDAAGAAPQEHEGGSHVTLLVETPRG